MNYNNEVKNVWSISSRANPCQSYYEFKFKDYCHLSEDCTKYEWCHVQSQIGNNPYSIIRLLGCKSGNNNILGRINNRCTHISADEDLVLSRVVSRASDNH